jgi:very-short-patch-repair endonuclease
MAQRMPEYPRDLVRRFRREPTESESLLWQHLRDRRLAGLKFRRQRPLGRFIADLCCDEVKLIVEIDGSIHTGVDQRESDAIREEQLESMGFRILRVTASEVLERTADVLERIRLAAQSQSPHPPAPYQHPHSPAPSPLVGEGLGVRGNGERGWG